VRTQIHVLSSLYISFVSKYKWGHRSTSCLLSIYRLYQSTSEDRDPRREDKTWICVLTYTLIQTIYREKTRWSFASSYKWGHRSMSCLLSIYRLYQSTNEDTDPCLVFSLYIVCIWICVLTCTLIQTIYREKTRRGSVSSFVLWYKRYIERRQDVDLYKWGHRSTSCLLSIYRLYQSTSEDRDPRLVFSLHIVCIKVQVRTQIHVLSSLYISFVSKYKWGHRSTEKTRCGSVSSLVLWYKRYIERRQDVDLCPHLYFDTNDI
jgi:hypothetical protein